MKNKYYLILVLSFAVIFSFFSYLRHSKKNNNDVVILQIVEHDALNSTRKGIEDYLKRCCSQFGIGYENAQGNTTLALQIGKRVTTTRPKLIIAIGTIAAQAFLKNDQIPVIFSSVTDPVSAGLIKDLKETATNYFTGVSNMINIEPQLKLIVDILPQAKKIGVIYNSTEANSMEILRRVKESAKDFNLEILEAVISSSNDVIVATQSLIHKQIDAIFVSNDNTALSSIQGITKIASSFMIPVFCSDVDTIKNGVLAAFGPDQYKIGIQTGKIIEKVLLGKKTTYEIPVEFPEKIELKINMKVAKNLKIKIDKSIVSVASEVIE
ncbi:MAG: ABC transporter substrate-binding protein [Candidatus Midichloria sp.]|nr:ABC transporter substrate-binding protein [Candidatus Midichloria sp.]